MLKGNLLVGQSGGPTPVINASLAGILSAAQKETDIEAIYGMLHGIEGMLTEKFIDLTHTPLHKLDLLAHTPASALGSCRHKVKEDEYERILKVCQAHNIRHFVYIGGNDSMDTCHRISELAESSSYDMQVMGVPKTIDNDLAHTDHTPGYGSAARFIALATRDTGLDLEAMATFDDVTILESMGRNAGWLTAASVLGKESPDEAPHLVYLPEIPFNEERFLNDVSNVYQRLGRVFVVVCEGLRDEEGEYVGQHQQSAGKDAFGHTLPTLTTGVASYLSELVNQHLELQSRFLRPVLIGRVMSACVSTTDRREALQVGKEAIARLAQGESGWMITLERVSSQPYRSQTEVVQLTQVANQEKLVPRDHINSEGNMITQKFIDYAMPLIDGPLDPVVRLDSQPIPVLLEKYEL